MGCVGECQVQSPGGTRHVVAHCGVPTQSCCQSSVYDEPDIPSATSKLDGVSVGELSTQFSRGDEANYTCTICDSRGAMLELVAVSYAGPAGRLRNESCLDQ